MLSEASHLAGKQWSGLFSDYYIPRWEMFFKYLEKSLLSGRKFNQSKFLEDFLKRIGKPFCSSTKLYPVHPVGDTVEVAVRLHRKWSHVEQLHQDTSNWV